MLSHRSQQAAYLRAVTDGLLLCLAFVLAYWIRTNLTLPLLDARTIDFASHAWMPAIAIPLFWALSRRRAHERMGSIIRDVFVPFIYLGLLLGTSIFLLQAKTFSRAIFFMFLAMGLVFLTVARILARLGSPSDRQPEASKRNLLIIGLGAEALRFRKSIKARPDYGIHVVGHLALPDESWSAAASPDLLGRIDDLKSIVEERVVDDVVFAVPSADLAACEKHVAWCEEVGVTVHLKVDFVRTLVAKAYPSDLDGIPLLTLTTTPNDPVALMLKRTLDLAVSGLMLLGLAPVFAVIALGIRLTSRGPAIFSQERVGLNGRLFKLHKFRSMYRDAERSRGELEAMNEASGPVFKIRKDPRITPFGRWLRMFSLDELPQLWNVLCGDMSLVGPRPPLAKEVREYKRWQRRRLSMKPGITCLWQVGGRSDVQFDTWMELDLEYIDNWSLALDLKILLQTVPAVVLARGAR